MRSIAKKATDAGWPDTLEAYTAATPQAGAALSELTQLQAYESSPQRLFMDAAHFRPQPPAELAGMHDYQIERLADPEHADGQDTGAADFHAALQRALAAQPGQTAS